MSFPLGGRVIGHVWGDQRQGADVVIYDSVAEAAAVRPPRKVV